MSDIEEEVRKTADDLITEVCRPGVIPEHEPVHDLAAVNAEEEPMIPLHGRLDDDDSCCTPCLRRKAPRTPRRVFATYHCNDCAQIEHKFHRFCDDCWLGVHQWDLTQKHHSCENIKDEHPEVVEVEGFDPKIHCSSCKGTRGMSAHECKLCDKRFCSKCFRAHQDSGDQHVIKVWRPVKGKKKIDPEIGYKNIKAATTKFQNTLRANAMKNFKTFGKKTLMIVVDDSSKGIYHKARLVGNLSMVEDFTNGRLIAGRDFGNLPTKWCTDENGVFVDDPNSEMYLKTLKAAGISLKVQDHSDDEVTIVEPDEEQMPPEEPVPVPVERPDQPVSNEGPSPAKGGDSAKRNSSVSSGTPKTPVVSTHSAVKKTGAAGARKKLTVTGTGPAGKVPPEKVPPKKKRGHPAGVEPAAFSPEDGPSTSKAARLGSSTGSGPGPKEFNPTNTLPSTSTSNAQTLLGMARGLPDEPYKKLSYANLNRMLKTIYINPVKLDKDTVSAKLKAKYKKLHIDPLKCVMCKYGFKGTAKRNPTPGRDRPSQQCIGCIFVGEKDQMRCGRVVHMDTCYKDYAFFCCQRPGCITNDFGETYKYICLSLAFERYNIVEDDAGYPGDESKLQEMEKKCEKYVTDINESYQMDFNYACGNDG